MLRLCPGDNLGQRFWAGSVLLKAARPADAYSFARNWLHYDKAEEFPPRGGTCFAPAPLSAPSAATVTDLDNIYTRAALVYSVALASFTIWGDCEIATQYLRMGAKLNPTVLMKILMRRDKPCMSP
jgi:hypothetical protein